MDNGKAAGPDNLPNKLWRCLGEKGINYYKVVLWNNKD